MGKHFALTFQLPAYRAETRTKKNNQTVDKKLGYAVLLGCGLLVVSYLVQVNTFSTKGFEIRNLQKQIDTLKAEQKGLELQAAELQSLQRIQGDPAIINMVPVSSISYVQTTSLTQR